MQKRSEVVQNTKSCDQWPINGCYARSPSSCSVTMGGIEPMKILLPGQRRLAGGPLYPHGPMVLCSVSCLVLCSVSCFCQSHECDCVACNESATSSSSRSFPCHCQCRHCDECQCRCHHDESAAPRSFPCQGHCQLLHGTSCDESATSRSFPSRRFLSCRHGFSSCGCCGGSCCCDGSCCDGCCDGSCNHGFACNC